MKPNVNTTQLGDRSLAADCLDTEKFVCQAYTTACYESANPGVRAAMRDIQNEELHNAEKIFSIMQRRGWYQPQPADQQQVQQIRQKFQGV
ncbi:MAG: spore coat protein [Firmicutes bacterium]|nr:spore coat protein [Bacillota bacterium]